MTPTLPSGIRLYAIGDIHGSLPLLKLLLEKIKAECAKDKIPSRKIFLGDYIDRGLYSRETIDFLLAWQAKEKLPPVFLLGNHEQVMREIILDRDAEKLGSWLAFGGRETLLSYRVRGSNPVTIVNDLTNNVPAAHVEFLRKLEPSVSFGDYFFCHAGVRPGVPLEAQREEDLVWIRDPFLNHAGPFGKRVVHGHSISLEAEFQPNRIGIDTGAYSTGCLTALGLEGDRSWLVQTK
jgi:serine/threonine protein phosphatase 1